MDAVAFPPPPPPFLDDDFDFGDFTFASAAPQPAPPSPQPAAFAAFDDDWGDFVASSLGSNPDGGSAPTTPPTDKSSAGAWEKPRGPLPLSLFGDDKEDDDEGPPMPPPTSTATAHQRTPSFESKGSRAADLKDLIVGLYGSQPPPAIDAPEASAPEVAEDDDGFGDNGWEFKGAPSPAAAQEGGRPAHGEGIEDMPKSFDSAQEDWSLFTSVDNELNHFQTTDHVGNHDSRGQSMKNFNYRPDNSSSILNLYKEHNLVDDVHVPQSCSESVLSSSDLFSNNEMNSSYGTDENHSIKSASDSILIDFYHKLREESVAMIFRYNKDIKEAEKSPTHLDRNNKVAAIEGEIQEIWEKLQDSSLAKDFRVEEQSSRDVRISELQKSTKEEPMKDFEQQYHLAEKLALAQHDMSLAVELYKHSVSTLSILELASKEEQCDYVAAWYSLFLSCAQELQHGAVIWQESCHAKVCDQVISEGVHCFIALGEIYRVAQILHLSMMCFKPWVLADPRMFSNMSACWDSCTNAWTSGLETALRIIIDSNHLDASVVKALLETIISINELEVANLQNSLANNDSTCQLTLLPTGSIPGAKVIVWNGNHYFVKVANLWANRVSSNPPRFSLTHVS